MWWLCGRDGGRLDILPGKACFLGDNVGEVMLLIGMWVLLVVGIRFRIEFR